MEQVQDLLRNARIEKFGGPWGSIIVLAAKPHQEHIENIDILVWIMCVSYRNIYAINKPFKFSNTCCDDARISFGTG